MALDELTEGDDFDELLSIVSDNSDDTLSVFKIVEQAPSDQQVLDEHLLDAVTSATSSTAVNVLDKSRIIFSVVASSVTSGFDIAIQGSPDGTNWGAVSIKDKQGTEAGVVSITADGTYVYKVVDSPKYIRANITNYSDGTVSAWVQGGAY